MIALLTLLFLLVSAVPVKAGQVFTTILDGYSPVCDGVWHSWNLQMSNLEAHGATLVMDVSGGFADAALGSFDGGDSFGIIAEGHVHGAGRYQFASGLNGEWIHVRSNLSLGGVCDPGEHMSLYSSLRWRPR